MTSSAPAHASGSRIGAQATFSSLCHAILEITVGFWGNSMPQTLTPADHPWRLKVPSGHPSWILAAEGETLLLGRVTESNPAPSLQRAGHSRSGAEDRGRWLGTRSWHLLGTDFMPVPKPNT